MAEQEQGQPLPPGLDGVVGDAVVVRQRGRHPSSSGDIQHRPVPAHLAFDAVAGPLGGRVDLARVEPALVQTPEQGVADGCGPRGLQVKVRLVHHGVPQARRVLQGQQPLDLADQDVADLRSGGVIGGQQVQQIGAGGHGPAVAPLPESAGHVAIVPLVPAVVEEARRRVLEMPRVEQELVHRFFGVAGVAGDAAEAGQEGDGHEKGVGPELILVVVQGPLRAAGRGVQQVGRHLLGGGQVLLVAGGLVEHEDGQARRGVVGMGDGRQPALDEAVGPGLHEVEVALVARRLPGGHQPVHGHAAVPVPGLEGHAPRPVGHAAELRAGGQRVAGGVRFVCCCPGSRVAADGQQQGNAEKCTQDYYCLEANHVSRLLSRLGSTRISGVSRPHGHE